MRVLHFFTSHFADFEAVGGKLNQHAISPAFFFADRRL
jgi:hypothetical protein